MNNYFLQLPVANNVIQSLKVINQEQRVCEANSCAWVRSASLLYKVYWRDIMDNMKQAILLSLIIERENVLCIYSIHLQ